MAVAGGPSSYDLSGTGTLAIAGAGYEWPVAPFFLVEPGLRYFAYRPQLSAGTTHFLFPEVSLQLQVPGGPFRPYLGGGAGTSFEFGATDEVAVTLHGAVGFRLLFDGWGLRPELRLRSIDPFAGVTADYTLAGLFRP